MGTGNLRVMILKANDLWFAQGMEIDYAAEGNSPEEVKGRFSEGLYATIEEHLAIYGNLNHFLALRPNPRWEEFLRKVESKSCVRAEKYSRASLHEMFPFDEITFYEMDNERD